LTRRVRTIIIARFVARFRELKDQMFKTVLAVAAIQLGIALLAGAGLGLIFDGRVALSAFAGGCIAVLGSIAYLAVWSLIAWGGGRPSAHLRAHVLAELSKVLAVSAALLWALSRHGNDMSAAAFLGAFVVSLAATWFGLALKA